MTGLKTTALGLFAALGLACSVQAQAHFPTAPVKLVVPYAPGGTGDVVARILGEKASADLGQPVVVDNRAGAGGAIGAQSVAHAKPDGHTLMFMATAHVILPSLQDVPYDPIREFTPVFGVTATPLVFAVRGKSNIRTMADLVAAAKARPQGLNYSSGGAGSISHLAAARLMKDLKISGAHVPYRGFSAAVQALLGDQVDFICAGVADVIGFTKSGDIRVLGVAAEQRHPLLPEVPTTAELGFADAVASSWNIVVAPAGTPKEATDRLAAAFTKAAADASVQDRLAKLGVSARARNRAELAKWIQDESTRWKRVIVDNAIKVEGDR